MRLLALLLLLTSCGYRFGPTPCPTATPLSISVPYVQGDIHGLITDAIIREISACHHFRYVNDCGDLILQATILTEDDQDIGFQYDRDPISGDRINRLEANERRRTMQLEFSILSGKTGEVLCGPYFVTRSTDYDFVISDSLKDISFIDPAGDRTRVLFFSLGQLDSWEGAYDSASIPLYRKLAKTLAEGLCHLDFSK